MVYLLGVVVVAALQDKTRSPAFLAALLATLAYDFFFVPPSLSLAVTKGSDLITLLTMFVVAQIISQLTITIHKHKNLIEIEKLRNTLLSSISHDLRTPLTAIMGSASGLLQVDDTITAAERKELSQTILDESERMNQLVNNVLQLARLESGDLRLSKQAYALEELIGIVLNRLKDHLGNRQVTVHLPEESIDVLMDSLLMEQVFMNLLENAIKFSRDNSLIEISAEIRNEDILVKVADQGIGVPKEESEKIFEKHYRGRSLQTPGIGLGLALCKSIIEAHGGKIWVESKDALGSNFCFTLPKAN